MTQNRNRLLTILSNAALALLTLSTPAHAEGEYVYSPNYCDFAATFPEEPRVSKMCEEKDPTACYDLVSYTKVFDMVSTVQIDIICNPSTEKLYNGLTKEKMIETVKNMTKDTVLHTNDTNARDGDGYREAGLVGLSRMGMDDSIYIAQLWSAKGSLMSVKAQLIGQQLDASDQLFAKILRTIGYKAELNAPAPAPKGTETKPAETAKEKPASPAPKP